jgi:hypothetical protein
LDLQLKRRGYWARFGTGLEKFLVAARPRIDPDFFASLANGASSIPLRPFCLGSSVGAGAVDAALRYHSHTLYGVGIGITITVARHDRRRLQAVAWL